MNWLKMLWGLIKALKPHGKESPQKSQHTTKIISVPAKPRPLQIAFHKPKRKINKVFIHCSSSDNPAHDDVAVIRRWHTMPSPTDPSKPWSDIGYHYFITKDGHIQAGRPLEKQPAAQKGHNAGSIAICLHGLLREKFTLAQKATLFALCWNINSAYLGKITFHGHCEVSRKLCPVLDYKAILNLSPTGQMLIGV